MKKEIEIQEEEQEQDLYEHFRLVMPKGQELLRIDKYLMNHIQNATRTKIQQAAEVGNIRVNDKPVKSNYRVKPFDVITILFAHPPREIELIPQNIPINIMHEDDDIIIVNKNAGMVVHPGFGNYKDTLINALVYHFENLPVRKEFKREEIQNSKEKTTRNKKQETRNQEPNKQFNTIDSRIRPGLVHRIDKNTSGILVVAKTDNAMNKLAAQFFDHSIDRTYWALVWGDVKENKGTITGNVGRHPNDRMLITVFPQGDEGKHAVTYYKVLERFGYVTLVECTLETGRTHQIRVHMKHIGHTLFNDERYGGNRILKGTTFSKYKQFVENCFEIMPRQGLHAKSLGFKHPATGKYIHFDSELPPDMKAVIEKWRHYATHKVLED